jgi:hypothetical protein
MALDVDSPRAASHRHMIAHLTGPLSAGGVTSTLPIVVVGGVARIEVSWITREPLLLLAPREPVTQRALRVSPMLDPAGAATPLGTLEFLRYTEAGAFLVVYRPPVGAETRTAIPFAIGLRLLEVDDAGVETTVPANDVPARLETSLVEGVMGRTLYLLGAEKQRIRRSAREISAMRRLSTARDEALDRLGADLGVPRFAEQIDFAAGQIVTQTRREPDDEFRRRIALYRPFSMATRHKVLERLNGPGGDADPNRGPLAAVGNFQPRFQIVEADNEFAVAIRLVAVGNPALRTNLLQFIRDAYLVEPLVDVPAARFISGNQRTEQNAMRARLRARFTFPAGSAIAGPLATALDRVGKCRLALQSNPPWPVLRAQDSTGGSRYELGLGVDLQPLPAGTLNAMVNRLQNPNRPPADDPEIEALLRSMQPQSAALDPEGRWLLVACGLRTVHRVSGGRIYASHFPTFGLVVSGNTDVVAGAGLDLEAAYHAPGDPGKHLVLTQGLANARSQWAAAGHPAWTDITDAQATPLWDAVTPRAAGDPAVQIFRAAGLPAVQTPGPVIQQLKRIAPELLQTISLAPAQAQQVIAGSPAVVADVRELGRILASEHLTSLLPLVSGNQVLFVTAVTSLPEAGLNLAPRRSTGFYWYSVPIQGGGGTLRPVGSRSAFTAPTPGLHAVVVIGYARRGLTDPFEYRVELPAGALLSLPQYEFLMNILERSFPVGVEVNTFSIRQEHVDLDGNGTAEPLDPSASRTYRPFLRPRLQGEASATLNS